MGFLDSLRGFGVQLSDRLWLIVPFLLLGIVWETVMATRERPRREWAINAVATTLYWAGDVLAAMLASVVIVSVVQRIPGHGLLPLPIRDGDPAWWSLLVTFGWLSISDFFYYWFHRWQHASAILWAAHEVHHSDHMNVTTTSRHHWVDWPIQVLAIMAPTAYICAPSPAVLGLGLLMSRAFGHFIHLDAQVSFGRLNWIAANPHHHRIHHSIEHEHRDKNFASMLPLWDVLFGTYYAPKRGEFPQTGLADQVGPKTAMQAAAWPFLKWTKLVTKI